MLKKSIIILVISLAFKTLGLAGEGMWIPLFLKSLNEKEMKNMGMKMSAEDIYSTNKSSLKDAIVHFGGFCTSELISPNGLLLTNHHCGYGQIQSHSTVDNNILKDGFWAKSYAEEKPCEGLRATFIVSIEDVSDEVLANVTDGMTKEERQAAIDEVIIQIKGRYNRVNFKDLQIKPYYQGNQYFAIETVTYPDVRLVGNPPESVGKFGADTDNWVWPRHTGDFSFFRIYAGPDNQPAQYSEDNKPFKPKHFLPISIDGVDEGDFSLVFGFPGRTNQYLPSTAVEQIVNDYNPAKIAMREAALEVMDKAMRSDEAIRLQYAPKFARIANYWKKWIGESTGIEKTGGIQRKLDYEAKFSKRVMRKRKFRKKYKNVLSEVKRAHKDIKDYQMAYDITSEMLSRNVEIFRQARQFRLLQGALKEQGESEFQVLKSKYMTKLKEWHSTYRQDIDKDVLAGQIGAYLKYMPKSLAFKGVQEGVDQYGSAQAFADHLFESSQIVSMDRVQKLMESAPTEFLSGLLNDPLYAFYRGLRNDFVDDIYPVYKEKQGELDEMQRKYMKAQMDVLKKKRRFYPDANSTLRVTYGKVEGYETEESGKYGHLTYLEGVIKKYKPGDYEFDVHPKLIELYENKDYGQYATKDGKMPVCFIGSNHTSGGNSGSPALDAYGNLIGLNFDRVWEGTMSDINYDRSICRNIMVDVRYILFFVDKFANADRLIEEMKLVRPKA